MAKCRSCGFLGVTVKDRLPRLTQNESFVYTECTQARREQIAQGEVPDLADARRTLSFKCTRHLWDAEAARDDYSALTDSREDVEGQANRDRRCAYFFRHQPGFSPAEHKDLQREDKTRKIILLGTLLGALIGATAAIIAQYIAS